MPNTYPRCHRMQFQLFVVYITVKKDQKGKVGKE